MFDPEVSQLSGGLPYEFSPMGKKQDFLLVGVGVADDRGGNHCLAAPRRSLEENLLLVNRDGRNLADYF